MKKPAPGGAMKAVGSSSFWLRRELWVLFVHAWREANDPLEATGIGLDLLVCVFVLIKT